MANATRKSWLGVGSLIALAVTLSLLALGVAPVRARPAEALAASSTTIPITLQRGLNGYGGVQDAYIDSDAANCNVNYGGVDLRVRNDQSQRALIRFDLEGVLPDNAVIDSATLQLYLAYQSVAGRSLTVQAYPLLRAWEEGTVTYNTPWAKPGAEEIGVDRGGAAVGTATFSAAGTWVSMDVTAIVRQWVQDSASNHGLILIGSPTAVYFVIPSSESSTNRPRLQVTYHLEGTPGPSPTPTNTGTPTLEPSPTPTVKATVMSTSKEGCTPVPYTDSKGKTVLRAGGQVLLVWQGTPTWAKVGLRHSNNRVLTHRVFVNGQPVGTLPRADWSATCVNGTYDEWYFDPTLLLNGVNTIEYTCEDVTDNWGANSLRLYVGGDVVTSTVNSIVYTTGRTYSPQTGWIQLPIGYRPDSPPRPLLVVCHWWSATGQMALYEYAAAANQRGWLLVAPDMGTRHTCAPDVQRDIIDAVEYMKSHYRVDPRRIYVIGKSMGGMFAAVTAAKYPDVFAAVAIDQAPTSLDAWYYESDANRQATLYAEVGAFPYSNPFAYQIRSPRYMDRNLKHVSLAITYAISDTTVPAHHSEDLYRDVLAWGANPQDVQKRTYPGVHGDVSPYWDWSLDFLAQHSLGDDPHDLSIITDEGKSYYWLTVEKSTADRWTEVNARYDDVMGYITATTVVTDSSVVLRFDLARMGFEPRINYTVEDLNEATGDLRVMTVAAGDQLAFTVSRGKHSFQITPGVAPTPVSVALQQGQPGPDGEPYSGAADCFIRREATPSPHAVEAGLRVAANDSSSVLLRFDTRAIPPGKVVKAAKLTLFTVNGWGRSDLNLNIYPLRRDWVPAEATWLVARAGASWGQAGANCEGTSPDCQPVDRGGKPVATVTLLQRTPVATPYFVNLTRLVQEWVDHPDDNYGLILKNLFCSDGSTTFDLASSRWPQSAWRPKLEIKFTDPTQVPTATPTPTPSCTPSPTAVPTASVYGLVWEDTNRDGLPGSGEPPLAGALLVLNGRPEGGGPAIVVTQTTKADGLYRFDGLPAGEYRLTEMGPAGYGSTTSNDSSRYLNAGDSWMRNFGHYRLPTPTPTATLRWRYRLPMVQG